MAKKYWNEQKKSIHLSLNYLDHDQTKQNFSLLIYICINNTIVSVKKAYLRKTLQSKDCDGTILFEHITQQQWRNFAFFCLLLAKLQWILVKPRCNLRNCAMKANIMPSSGLFVHLLIVRFTFQRRHAVRVRPKSIWKTLRPLSLCFKESWLIISRRVVATCCEREVTQHRCVLSFWLNPRRRKWVRQILSSSGSNVWRQGTMCPIKHRGSKLAQAPATVKGKKVIIIFSTLRMVGDCRKIVRMRELSSIDVLNIPGYVCS